MKNMDGPFFDERFEERYRAISSRDSRFDGQFYTAVISTGIYCRPSCPARTPKPENVRFFLTSAAAHEAGFRACKRCVPEAAPESPEWNSRRDVAGRAMRLIFDGVVDREGVEGLATRLGYTPRHIHRLLTAELGAGPQALARARRAQSARALLVGTDLGMSEVAFAAGFGSVRQFNQTVDDVFALSPRALRAKSVRFEPSRRENSEQLHIDIDLPVRQPFDAPGIFGFLAARAIGGIEAVGIDDDDLHYARTLVLPHGPGAFDVTARVAERRRRSNGANPQWKLTAHLELSSLADVAPAVSRIRRLLDLDADPVATDAALGSDPVLAPLVAGVPGIRVPGAVDAEEMVVRAMIGQQISVRAATGHLSRLAERLGSHYSSSIAGLSRLFPTSLQIAEGLPVTSSTDPGRPLRLPAQSVNAIRGITSAMADGDLLLHAGMETEAMRDVLMRQPRIGPWSASYISMRVLGDPDLWLEGDAALLSGARSLGLVGRDLPAREGQRSLARIATGWAPWRTYAAMHVWQAALVAARPSGAPDSTRGAQPPPP
ncbi:Ada metal-binding domain-containing protein [Actinomycetaceae bacterium L2_0104]